MKIIIWQIINIVVSIVLGTLLHFTFEWSGRNIFVGIFSAVNESTWEHLKLVFFPMILMAIISYFIIGNKSKNYWFAQTIGILTAMIFITVFFYTYTGVIGTNFGVINILSFIVGILLGEYVIYKILISKTDFNMEWISILILISLLLSFITYTCNPPKIQLFKDPITESYGLIKKK